MDNVSKLTVIILWILVLSAHVAFSKTDHDVSQDLFLSVNQFKMTVGEFNALVEHEQAVAKTLKLPPILPEDVILQIIYKQLLIQEAKKSQANPDNKSIRYEPESSDAALITKLLATKSDEFKMNLTVSDDELSDYYNNNRLHFNGVSFQKSKNIIHDIVLKKKIHQSMEEWLDGLRLNADIIIVRDLLKPGNK